MHRAYSDDALIVERSVQERAVLIHKYRLSVSQQDCRADLQIVPAHGPIYDLITSRIYPRVKTKSVRLSGVSAAVHHGSDCDP